MIIIFIIFIRIIERTCVYPVERTYTRETTTRFIDGNKAFTDFNYAVRFQLMFVILIIIINEIETNLLLLASMVACVVAAAAAVQPT